MTFALTTLVSLQYILVGDYIFGRKIDNMVDGNIIDDMEPYFNLPLNDFEFKTAYANSSVKECLPS